jgi:hypothetical protein
MILVQIVTLVREDEIGRDVLLQPLEEFLHVSADVREETVLEVGHDDLRAADALEKGLRAATSFSGTVSVGAQDDPPDVKVCVSLRQAEDRPAAPDFDVVCVRADSKNALERPVRPECKCEHG